MLIQIGDPSCCCFRLGYPCLRNMHQISHQFRMDSVYTVTSAVLLLVPLLVVQNMWLVIVSLSH